MSINNQAEKNCFICEKHKGNITVPGGAIYHFPKEDSHLKEWVGHGLNREVGDEWRLGESLKVLLVEESV
ncbi:hypothetical protein [Bacillus mycoides]|uniref:hypothetical protein n=1 Tax=Bacillus mycoides TaxID=1405 RepID=UPI003D25AC9D